MKWLKKTLTLFLLFPLGSLQARAIGKKTTPQQIAPQKLVAVQPICKIGAGGQPMCKVAMAAQKQAAPQKKYYAGALIAIRTQIPSDQILINNRFTPKFINFVTSLNLSEAQTQALLEAGVHLHATLTDNDQITQQTLSSLHDSIKAIVQQNKPQPILQPVAPKQAAPAQLVQPIIVKPAIIAPKPAALVQPIANVNAPNAIKIGKTNITFVKGDITQQNIDAIVNAANENLRHGGGIAAAISQAAGPSLQKYSNAMPAVNAKGEKCPTGEAVITPAFNLEKVGIKKIIHAVGPLGSDPNKKQLLTAAYQNSLKVAKNNGLRSVALPAISTAIFGYNINEATPVAFAAVRDFVKMNPKTFDEIRFVLFSDKDMKIYEKFKNELIK
jgi:O-acetyl-ADP-ribose deacetylase (regulator of RNase III)